MKSRLLYLCLFVALGVICSQCTKVEQSEKVTKKEVSIQLYSVRSLLDGVNKDGQPSSEYMDVLNKLAQMGYTSVEAANYADGKFYGRSPENFRTFFAIYCITILCSNGFWCNFYAPPMYGRYPTAVTFTW